MKLVEELTDPNSLCGGVSHNVVLSLNVGTREYVLPL
jgi:hypothetical protein